MILLKYLDMCLTLLKQWWSSIRHALPVVTWRARVESSVALVPQSTASPEASSPPTATTVEETLAQVINHLEYLGYETLPVAPDGWSSAIHRHRYNFHLRTYARDMRLHCTVPIGAAIGSSRAAWLEFLNTANERGMIAQFSLFEDKLGVHRVRMFAFVSGAYNRKDFAMVMDMWHDDLDLVRRAPASLWERSAGEERQVAVTVN